ncbi:CCA tRNA nucleotidyltransferase [Bacillus sp. SB49]|uniref:CCA tRNA nucleotidyltransferase n=1 Tax=Bacillaceae TaxID=186817 RepID=UPI0003F901FC|nr:MULTISPECIES: CCA tRNA nucleotidyltransferase [Bacillaceae]QHT46849.1 CCA tRNA nucleotidyltransferase [Bacillus sp. SB49]
MSRNSIFREAFEVLAEIEAAGGEAYVVGGAVRDYLSGRPVGDIDIASSEPPERIQEIFDKVIPVGVEHGTVIVRYRSESYEVTTYRKEATYSDFRHPDEVTFVRSISDDLARRDFTINAMAMDRHGTIIDPFNGREAVDAKRIEAVGDPVQRFREDPLRMMRAARFHSQLLYTLDKKTEDALKKEASMLRHISIERIAEEMRKLYAGEGYKESLQLLERTSLKQELPILHGMELSTIIPSGRLVSWGELAAFLCLRSSECTPATFVKQWKLSNRIRREADQLTEAFCTYQEQNAIRPWLVYRLPFELFPSFSRLAAAEGTAQEQKVLSDLHALYEELPIKTLKEAAFQAEDLIAMFPDKKRGPWIADKMKAMEYEIVTGKLKNEYDAIKEWAVSWNPPVND